MNDPTPFEEPENCERLEKEIPVGPAAIPIEGRVGLTVGTLSNIFGDLSRHAIVGRIGEGTSDGGLVKWWREHGGLG